MELSQSVEELTPPGATKQPGTAKRVRFIPCDSDEKCPKEFPVCDKKICVEKAEIATKGDQEVAAVLAELGTETEKALEHKKDGSTLKLEDDPKRARELGVREPISAKSKRITDRAEVVLRKQDTKASTGIVDFYKKSAEEPAIVDQYQKNTAEELAGILKQMDDVQQKLHDEYLDADTSGSLTDKKAEGVDDDSTAHETAGESRVEFRNLDSKLDGMEAIADTGTETAVKDHQDNESIDRSRVIDSLGFSKDGDSGANWLSWLVKTSDHWLYATVAINAVYEWNKEALGLLGTLVVSAIVNLCLKTIFRDGNSGGRLALGSTLVIAMVFGAFKLRDSSTSSIVVACTIFVVVCVGCGLFFHFRDKHHVVDQMTRKAHALDGRRPRAGGAAGMAFETGGREGPYATHSEKTPMLVVNSVEQPVTGSYHMGCEGGQPQIGRVGLYGVTSNGSTSVAMVLGNISDSYGMPSSHMQLWSAFVAYAVVRATWGDVGRKLDEHGDQAGVVARVFVWVLSVVILLIVGLDRVQATKCNSLGQMIVGFLAGASTGVVGYTMVDEKARS